MTSRKADAPPALGRRTLLAGGFGAVALLAAPARACVLVPTGPIPRFMMTDDERARIYLDALLREANKGESATLDELHRLPHFEIIIGEESIRHWAAPRMLVSHGRRDEQEARLEGMVRLARARDRMLYLLALQRRRYFPRPPEIEDGCNRSPAEGFHSERQAWLYVYRPDSPMLRRLPELDRDLWALLPQSRGRSTQSQGT
jgi:hypothetical protein